MKLLKLSFLINSLFHISLNNECVTLFIFQLYEIHRIYQCVWWRLSTGNSQFPRTASVGESKKSRATTASTATADFRGSAFESNRVRLYWYVLSMIDIQQVMPSLLLLQVCFCYLGMYFHWITKLLSQLTFCFELFEHFSVTYKHYLIQYKVYLEW